MRPRISRCIPPWEVHSRQAYQRRKSLAARACQPREALHVFFKRCTKAIADHRFGAPTTRLLTDVAHTQELPSDENIGNAGVVHSASAAASQQPEEVVPSNTPAAEDATSLVDTTPLLEDVNVRLQYLGYVGLSRRDKRMLIDFVNRIAPCITTSVHALKFLNSMSCVVNVRCLPSSSVTGANIKLACREAFESLFRRLDRSADAYHVVASYLKLCAFYGDDVSNFSPVYHHMVEAVVSGDVFVTERQLDDLLFVYQRLAICDRRFMKYHSDRISRHFECFSDDQVCNFARYLVKSIHARARPLEIGATADYSREFGASDTRALLDGFDVASSSYLRCLETQLPVCLHQYSYYNLVDLGEFYSLFNIQSSVRVRFSTELWKYLYTLRYGYPIKALVILSKLGLGDSATYGRLIRNIPMTLAFRWPLNLVSECLISLEWAKSSKIYVILAHYLSKNLSAQFNARNVARIFDSLYNKRVALLGLYQKVLRIQSLNPGWLGCEELLTVARYGKEVGFSLSGISGVLKVQDLDGMDYRKAITLLYVMENPDAAFLKRCIQAIHNKGTSQCLEFDSLMQLLKACYRHKIWLCASPQLALEALRDVETVEAPVLLELLELLSLAGPIGEPNLLARLEGYVEHVIADLPLRTAGRMLWLCFSLGVSPDSACFISLLRRFNHLYETSYNEDHLLQVLGEALKRLKSQTVEVRTFLRHLEAFKDVSWRREPAEIGKIRAFQRNVGCKAFVSVFPFTADVEVDATALSDYVTRIGGSSLSLAEPCLQSRSSWCASSDIAGTVLLDLCGDPYVTVVERDGNERQALRFYYQLRGSLVGRPFAHLLDSSVH